MRARETPCAHRKKKTRNEGETYEHVEEKKLKKNWVMQGIAICAATVKRNRVPGACDKCRTTTSDTQKNPMMNQNAAYTDTDAPDGGVQ
jgi:hypothetical protein